MLQEYACYFLLFPHDLAALLLSAPCPLFPFAPFALSPLCTVLLLHIVEKYTVLLLQSRKTIVPLQEFILQI
jgi:hypothetical protein